MSLFSKSVSFLAVFAVIPASYALTARPSVIGTASSRMPTMTSYITGSGTTVSGTTTTTSSLLSNKDCIDAYTECMKGDDACGSDFEECTTKILFNGKMPQCLSTLSQCSTSGISSLFGTGTITALSSCTKDSNGDYVSCTYPTDGSLLGQMITGAAISNKYDTGTCVKRYTSCLTKDNVCGADFELCTTEKEFRKQRVFCESTLARCQAEGKTQLFGSTNTSNVGTGRIKDMMEEGAALAAANAVATCYKIADQCILNACADNPFQCYENSTQYIVDLVKSMSDANNAAAITSLNDTLAEWGKKNVSGYIKNECFDTIAGSKYCHIASKGSVPSASKLKDEDERAEVYDDIYASRMNTAMNAKITDLVTQFDTKTKNKCADTIKSCVMRTCGSGSGAACYSEVFGSNGGKTINQTANGFYEELQTGCSAIVNSDPNCKYAALNPNSAGTYTYQYKNDDAFTTLFPTAEEGKDPIGVVAALNASLQSSYNDAAIAQMRKRCQNVATSCVKSMCGTDYQNCYRNRTDVYSTLTNTSGETYTANNASGMSGYDRSMNKVGGVLDYTIVLGLCLDTVKNASACEEHLKIQEHLVSSRNRQSKSNDWGSGSVRDNWIDAGSATAVSVGAGIQAQDENGENLCTAKGGTTQGRCDTLECDGQECSEPVMISEATYYQSQAASSLFKDLVYDLEKEAQAKYNAKLTREQNQCLAGNNGGIKGKNDLGSTFMWVKLRGSKVPKTYPMSGLKENEFVASNDIYGSFCRVRVTLQSDEKKIQDIITKGNASWGTAYFAAGDAFTCGSWIPESALTDLANSVASDARATAAQGNGRTKGWMAVLGTLGGGALGGVAGNKIADSNFLGGLLGTKNDTSDVDYQAGICSGAAEGYVKATSRDDKSAYFTKLNSAVRKLNSIDKKKLYKDGQTLDKIGNTEKSLSQLLAAANVAHQAYIGGNTQTVTPVTGTAVATIKSITLPASSTKLAEDAIKMQFATMQPNDTYRSYTETVTCYFMCDTFDGTIYRGNFPQVCNGKQKGEQVQTNNVSACSAEKGATSHTYTYTVYYDDASAIAANKDLADRQAATQNATNTASDNLAAANTAVSEIGRYCSTLSADPTAAKKADRNKAITTAVGVGVGSIAGGVLAYQATKSVQDAKLDKVEQEAYDQFMSEVGSHITCMIGSEPAGTFGDIVETTLVE
ncbi:hypothetical protein HDR61_02375 [bacterium]|nr:hypothetical protein [bacterium]